MRPVFYHFRKRFYIVLFLVLLMGTGLAGFPLGSYADSDPSVSDSSLDGEIDDPDDFFSDDSDDANDSDGFFEDDTSIDDGTDDFFNDGTALDGMGDLNSYDSDESDDSIFSLKGSLKEQIVFNVSHDKPEAGEIDHRGISSLKTEIDLELGVDLYDSWDFFISGNGFYDLAYEINGRENYEKEFLNEYEKEIELRKLYLRGSLTSKLDLKIGRQIVVWGKSDNIRVTDVLNPLDLREPGMTDIEDLRLPVFMTKLDYYWKNWALSSLFIHEHRFNKLPVYGSDFYPLPISGKKDTIPAHTLENTEFAFALSSTFKGFDLAFYIADIYDDTNFLALEYKGDGILPVMNHARIRMYGFAMNKTFGNWLLKAESALFDDIKLSAYKYGYGLIANDHKYTRLDVLGGVEYYGFSNTTIGFEAVDRYYTDFNSQADKSGAEEHNVQYAARFSRNFLHDTMELTLVASLYGGRADDGGFFRTGLTYDLSDSVKVGGGFVLYESGSAVMLQGIGDNDRIYCNVTYNF